MSLIDKLKRKDKAGKADVPKAEKPKEEASSVPKGETAAIKKTEKKMVGVLVRPLVTEKAAYIGQYGQYIFEVRPKANKISIIKAVQSIYGVKPVRVNIIHVRGRRVRYGKTSGVTKKWKKAVITLRPGDKIEVHEGV